jgi:hypothetical protein
MTRFLTMASALADRRTFAPDDGGGTPAAASTPAAVAGGEGAAGAAAGAPAAPAVSADGKPAGAPAGYRPEGLPETMYGQDDKETMDKMANALKGYRIKESNNGVGENVEAYTALKIDTVPEAIRPFMADLAKDPVWSATAVKAHELKLPVAASHALLSTAFEAAQKAGLLDDTVDPVAERAKLVPEAAKALPKERQDAAIDARLEANENFVRLQMQNGGLPKEAGEHALLMLMDRADGNQFIEWVSGKIGGGPAPVFDGAAAGGANTREALRAELAKPENDTSSHKFDRKSYDALMQRYQALPQ